MDRRVFPLALLALLAAAPAAARADDLASLRGKIGATMHAAKSFVVTTTATTGFRVVTTFAAPDRYHSTLSYNGTTDVILIGPVAYISSDGRTYRKTDAPPEMLAAQGQFLNVPVDRALPDTVENGKTWGRFATTSSGLQKDQHLICTYDKQTYRIGACANEGLTLAFSRYDDPANVVGVPAVVAAPGR